MLFSFLKPRPRRRSRSVGPGVQQLETRALLALSKFPFQTAILHTETGLAGTGSNFVFDMGDWDRNNFSDMFAIKKSATGSGHTEVFVFLGDTTNYARFSAAIPTALPETNGNWTFKVIDWDKGTKPDLMAINQQGSAGSVEVKILTGESNFQNVQTFKTIQPNSQSDIVYDVADWNHDNTPDLITVIKNSATSNATEVHVISGSPNANGLRFQSFLDHLVTGLHGVEKFDPNWEFEVADMDQNGSQDLVVVKKANTDSGKTEVHVLNGDGPKKLSSFSSHIATSQNATNQDYQFVVLPFVHPNATSRAPEPDLVIFQKNGNGVGLHTEIHVFTGDPLPAKDGSHHPFTSGSNTFGIDFSGPHYADGPATGESAYIGYMNSNAQMYATGNLAAYNQWQMQQLNAQSANLQTTATANINAPINSIDSTLGGQGTMGDTTASNTVIAPNQLSLQFNSASLAAAISTQTATTTALLTFNSLTADSRSTLQIDLAGSTAVSGYDQIKIQKTVALNGMHLALTPTNVPSAGGEFTIVRNDGSAPVGGIFSLPNGTPLPEGAIVAANFGGSGKAARISYLGGDGNDVTIVVDGDYTFQTPASGSRSYSLNYKLNRYQLIDVQSNQVLQSRIATGLSKVIISGVSGQAETVSVDISGGFNPVGGVWLKMTSEDSVRLDSKGSADTVSYRISANGGGALSIAKLTGSIFFSPGGTLQDNLATPLRTLTLSNEADFGSISTSTSGTSLFSLKKSSGEVLKNIRIPNPSVARDELKFDLGAGNDQFSLAGIQLNGKDTKISFVGGLGSDVVEVSGPVVNALHVNVDCETLNMKGGSLSADSLPCSWGVGQTLQGYGKITGNTKLAFTGGVLHPTGLLELPSISLDNVSKVVIDLGVSKLQVTGTVNLNQPSLEVAAGKGFVSSSSVDRVILQNDGSDAVVGSFRNLPHGSEFHLGELQFFRMHYRNETSALNNEIFARPLELKSWGTSVTVTSLDSDPNFATNSRGDSVFAWQDSIGNLYFQTVNASGTPTGQKTLIAKSGNLAWAAPLLSMNRNGDFVVGYNVPSTNDWYLQRYGATGKLVDDPIVWHNPNDGIGNGFYFDNVALADNGTILIAGFGDYDTAGNRPVYVKLVDTTGKFITPAPVLIGAYPASSVLGIATDASSNFYLLWQGQSNPEGAGQGYQAFIQKISHTGAKLFTVMPRIDIDLGPVEHPGYYIAANRTGNFVVASDNIGGTIRWFNTDGSLRTSISNPISWIEDISLDDAGNLCEIGLYNYTNAPSVEAALLLDRNGTQKYSTTLTLPDPTSGWLRYSHRGSLADDGSLSLLKYSYDTTVKLYPTFRSEAPDLVNKSLVKTDTSLTLNYEIDFGIVNPFDVAFYISSDRVLDSGDKRSTTLRVSASADLSSGSHTKTFTLGTAVGQVPAPGRGLAAATGDYYVIAVLDPDDMMYESDTQPLSEDNTALVLYPVNDIPVLTIAGASAYKENGAALLIAGSSTVQDVDSPKLDKGKLTIAITKNAQSTDRLAVRHQGTAAGQVGLSGLNVTYGGVTIGTFAGGSGTTPLVITFNSGASIAATQAVLRNITYLSVSDNPSTLDRTVSFQLTDGDGGTSLLRSIVLTVAAVNDLPVINGFGADITYVENSVNPVLISGSTVAFADSDSADFRAGGLIVRISSGGTSSDRLVIRSTGSVATNSSSRVLFNGAVVGAFSGGTGTTPLVITWTAAVSPGMAAAVLRSIAYSTTSDNPAAKRTVSVQITDGDGGTSAAVTKLINVTPVNDKPVITGFGGPVSYTEDSVPVGIAGSTATISDVDSLGLNGGVLTAKIIAGALMEDSLLIRSNSIITTDAKRQVFHSGVMIGTFVGGVGSTPLVVTLNAQATPERATALLRSLGYRNTSQNPNTAVRTLLVQVTDGKGGVSVAVTKTLSVLPVNDSP
ncbi:MAG: hypothetical protein U0936_13910 [Planctomycetaceae bacterium]